MIAALLLLAAAPESQWRCDSDNLPQQGLNICAERAFEQADAAMNAQWKITTAAIKDRDGEIDRSYDHDPTGSAALLAAQRAWLTYRDQQCLVESFEMRGGSAAPMLLGGCQARLTRERTKELKSLIDTGN